MTTSNPPIGTPAAVVPHYGDPADAAAMVAALQAQTVVPAQIIVVDDASPVPFPDTPGVTVVRRAANGGFGSAVNSGIAAVEHEAVLVLNSDLEINSTFVEEMITAAQPWWPAVVAPQILGHDGETQWVGRHFPTARHQIVEWLTPLARFRPRLHDAVGHDTRCVTGATVTVDWVMGAAMMLPVAEVRRIGGFDEGFFMNAEEVDLQRRLRATGVPAVFAGSVVARHEGGGSSDPGRRRQWLVDARFRYARKWGSARRLRIGLVAASWINFVVNLGREVLGRDVRAVAVLRQELGYLRSTGEVRNA